MISKTAMVLLAAGVASAAVSNASVDSPTSILVESTGAVPSGDIYWLAADTEEGLQATEPFTTTPLGAEAQAALNVEGGGSASIPVPPGDCGVKPWCGFRIGSGDDASYSPPINASQLAARPAEDTTTTDDEEDPEETQDAEDADETEEPEDLDNLEDPLDPEDPEDPEDPLEPEEPEEVEEPSTGRQSAAERRQQDADKKVKEAEEGDSDDDSERRQERRPSPTVDVDDNAAGSLAVSGTVILCAVISAVV